MNIEHLRYVLEIDRAGSISQAADNLYMGQPNLSKAIKELENTLGITIFRRTFKGAEITSKGREFLRFAQSILQQYEEMKALGREDKNDVQELRVTVPRASYAVDAFTTMLTDLDYEKPVQIDFMETNSMRAIQDVADGRADFGIIRCKTDYQSYFTSVLYDNGLAWRSMLEFKYMVLFAQAHPLAAQEEVDERELYPFIEIIHGDTVIPHVPRNVTETERGTTPGNKKVLVYERGSQFDILARVPGSYMWVSPVPEDLLKRNGLVQRKCKQSPGFSDLLIYQTNHRFSTLENDYLERLEQAIDTVLEHEVI